VDTNGVGGTHSARSQLSDVLILEPNEHVVIRQLGNELAQAKVDLAFALARLSSLRAAVAAIWSVSTPVESGCGDCPPMGTIVPADALLTLQSLVD
jgi:hypothetical protein